MTTTTSAHEPLDTPPAAGEVPTPPAKRQGLNTDTVALAGVFIAMFAFLAAIFAVGLATRAIDEHQDLQDAIAAGGVAAEPSGSSPNVELREFAIGPSSIEMPAGEATIAIENAGTLVHNLSVDGRASEMLAGGESGELDLSGLAPGTYTMRCDVPGHAAAGMTGTLTVG